MLEAIAEFDRIGREGVLSKYGFGLSRDYVVVLHGKQCDSKALVGAAVVSQLPGEIARA